MKLLQRFALWLLRITGYQYPVATVEKIVYHFPEVSDELLAEAKKLCSALKDWDASGEAKRHQVYAKLIKQFPQEKKQNLALAIELAVRDAG